MAMSHTRSKILAGVLTAYAIPAIAVPLILDCPIPLGERDERKRIQQVAKGVVERKSQHELQATVTGRTLRFIDKPSDYELDGTYYRFCDRKDGFILLMFAENDSVSGKLINEANGQVTPGGERVSISADRRAYFASEQPNGLDGSVWNIYSVDGRLSWSGFSFLPLNGNSDEKSADLSNPKWEANGEFSAEAYCITKIETKWKVKLVNTAGVWDWRPKRKCPKQ